VDLREERDSLVVESPEENEQLMTAVQNTEAGLQLEDCREEEQPVEEEEALPKKRGRPHYRRKRTANESGSIHGSRAPVTVRRDDGRHGEEVGCFTPKSTGSRSTTVTCTRSSATSEDFNSSDDDSDAFIDNSFSHDPEAPGETRKDTHTGQ